MRKFAIAMVLLAIVGIGGYFGSIEYRQAAAREKLAFTSLVDRLPKGKPIPPTHGLDAVAKARWAKLDDELASGQRERATLLQALHERTRTFFVSSPGAGSGRDFAFTDEMILDPEFPKERPDQPGSPASFPTSPGERLKLIPPAEEHLARHRWGLFLFFNPYDFGYVKGRDRVAGFEPHGFRYPVPDSKEPLRLDHVHLVGILTQDAPVVYLTDKMPSMDQIEHSKTRPLDLFESAGLPSLVEGRDLSIASQGETLRMLGAIRAMKTCQQCHDAEVGDLLGAFSYTLRQVPKKAE